MTITPEQITIYIVATEEWYGGTEEAPMKAFRSKEEATEYMNTLSLDSVCREFVM